MAYDEKKKDMRTYRLDRMKEVGLTGIPREGEDDFAKLDMSTYSQRRFGMHRGTQRVVTVHFLPPLLDTVVERFRTKDAMYDKPDDRYYAVRANVQISVQLFGWLLGFCTPNWDLYCKPFAISSCSIYLLNASSA